LKTKKEEIEKKKERNQEEKKKKFLAFETELLLRPNLGASRDAPDAPSHTSMYDSMNAFKRCSLLLYIRRSLNFD